MCGTKRDLVAQIYKLGKDVKALKTYGYSLYY